jgi:ketosteroid isomerase-like protein
MNQNPTEIARLAFEHLCGAGETGNWQPLLDLIANDFEFYFPAGAFRGQHTGEAGKTQFLAWVQHRLESRSIKTLNLSFSSGEWSVFCVNSVGEDKLGRFETHVALFFRVTNNQISAYREYIGDIGAWI